MRVPLRRFRRTDRATRDVVRLDRVSFDHGCQSNPVGRGVNVMLGVPLVRSDTVLGVLHVGRPRATVQRRRRRTAQKS
jgi:hypothetical protein